MKYIACCSGGKDSVATVILAHEHNEPLDEIVFAEVMFSNNISGELPEHIDFVKNKLFPTFEEWGYKTHIVRSGETMIDWFFHMIEKPTSKNAGKLMGFPMRGGCVMNSKGKIKAIHDYKKNIGEEYTDYVGIAIDEDERLERLKKQKNKISLLERYGYTEQMAYELCVKYGLLSPSYSYAKRGGCWFCPNQGKSELKHLYFNHRDLFNLAMWLETLPEELNILCKDGKFKRMMTSGKFLKEYAEIFESEAELERDQVNFEDAIASLCAKCEGQDYCQAGLYGLCQNAKRWEEGS